MRKTQQLQGIRGFKQKFFECGEGLQTLENTTFQLIQDLWFELIRSLEMQ